MLVENKSTVTPLLLEQLQKNASKVDFMPDAEIMSAIRLLEEQGIPNNKNEEYKYCNIEAVIRKEFKNVEQGFQQVTETAIAAYKLPEAYNLVIANGVFEKQLSDTVSEKGILIKNLSELTAQEKQRIASQAKSESDALIALNTAFCHNGLYLQIDKNSTPSKPIHIIYINNNQAVALVNTRNFIYAQANVQAQIIESFVNAGTQKIFSNFVSEKLLEENAQLKCVTFQHEGHLSYSVNTNQVKVHRYANYQNHTFTLSGELVRNNHQVVLADENCEAHINGLFVTNGTQLVDNHTLIDHQKPHCESNELYKGIANGKSTGVFNGKIFVRKDAQKTNAYQSSKNILMSDDATINTKPQLEIYADDVKCSHGTSTGKVDEEALFYLKARGIGDNSARKLLLQAFAQELIDNVELESLNERIIDLFKKAI